MTYDARHLCFELFDELEQLQQLQELLQIALDCCNDDDKDRVIRRVMLLLMEYESSADCRFDNMNVLRNRIFDSLPKRVDVVSSCVDAA